jgi:hypothetical protein
MFEFNWAGDLKDLFIKLANKFKHSW